MTEFLVHSSALLIVLLFCRWYYSTWTSALEKVIWIGLIVTSVLIVFEPVIQCYLGVERSCRSGLNPLIGILFIAPDLVFLGSANLIFKLGRSENSDADVERTVQEFPYDGQSIFILGTTLCLAIGTIWRYGLTGI
jgi:hypothetical protein